jgi:hypothetical protein
MADLKRPLVGVGVIIHDGAGSVIMGERAGSHGAGKTSLSIKPLPIPSCNHIMLLPLDLNPASLLLLSFS